MITKRKRDENKNIPPKKAKAMFDVNTTGAITSTPDNNAAVASTSSQGMKNKTIAENKPACGGKDVIINTTKPTHRVKRVPKKVPLLNETQVINAVKEALNEQPIIILPIFLGEDCNKTNRMCIKFWSNCYGLCTTQPPDCSMKVTIKCCNSVSSSRQNDTSDSTNYISILHILLLLEALPSCIAARGNNWKIWPWRMWRIFWRDKRHTQCIAPYDLNLKEEKHMHNMSTISGKWASYHCRQ